MAHQYPLHRDVIAECQCCHMEREFRFISEFDVIVCPACTAHYLGSRDPAHREADHLGVWVSEIKLARDDLAEAKQDLVEARARFAEQDAQRRTVIAQLQEALRQGVNDQSPADVQRLLADAMVREAHEKRDLAYRSRDHVYRMLWRLDEAHHESATDEHECICGLSDQHCPVMSTLTGNDLESLRRWEQSNIDRSKDGRAHGLPREHPDFHEHHRPIR